MEIYIYLYTFIKGLLWKVKIIGRIVRNRLFWVLFDDAMLQKFKELIPFIGNIE